MILPDLMMLVVSSPRIKAYLQALLSEDLCPSFALIMENKEKMVLPGQLATDVAKALISANKPVSTNLFDINKSIYQSLEEKSIPYKVVYNTDPNSEEIYEHLQQRQEKYVIYSGSGGIILKPKLLDSGKRFLHVHPGSLPDYRGSTTIYYSLLRENKCFASAFFLEKEIDAGGVMKEKTYLPPEDRKTIDYEYDPYIRADVLKEVIKEYAATGCFPEAKPCPEEGETYFIIHPILKHIAILAGEKK